MILLSWLLIGLALFMFIVVLALIGVLIHTIIDTHKNTHQWKDK